MILNKQMLLKWSIVALALILLVIILVQDIGGWGAFLIDVFKTFIVQTLLAGTIFGSSIFILIFLRGVLETLSSKPIFLTVFLAALVLTLPLLSQLFHRPLDIYDLLQTILLLFVFYKCADLFRYQLMRLLTSSVDSQKHVSDAQPLTSPDMLSISEKQLYGQLLGKVQGDKRVAERLINFERKQLPRANLKELLQRANERWQHDNRLR